jgi:integrase
VSDLVPRPNQVFLTPELEGLARRAETLRNADVRTSTRTTYAYLNNVYAEFFQRHGLDPYAPQTLVLFVTARLDAGDKETTLRARVAAVARLCKESGRPDPTTDPEAKELLRGAFRSAREARPGTRRVAAATYENLLALVAAIETLVDAEMQTADGSSRRERTARALRMRDRALVLFGFAIGRRGSELAGVDVGHIQKYEHGWVVAIPRSKTNKSGEPEYVGVPKFEGDPLCPVSALEEWLEFEHISAGPVFRTLSFFGGGGGNRMRREDISRRLAAIAARAGLPGIWRSHSLRRGIVTSAEQRNIARSRTRLLTGWTSDAMFSRYTEHRDRIAQSPLHEIYGRRPPDPTLNFSEHVQE